MIKEHISLHSFVNKTPAYFSCVQLKKEDLVDIQKFRELISENSELLKNIPIATYQQYSDAGYTPQQYVSMLQTELPTKIKQLNHLREEKIENLLASLKDNADPTIQNSVAENIKLLKKPGNLDNISTSITLLEKRLDGLKKNNSDQNLIIQVSAQVERLKEQKASSQFSSKIRAIETLLKELPYLDLDQGAHTTDISSYTLATTAAVYSFVNDKSKQAATLDFLALFDEVDVGPVMK